MTDNLLRISSHGVTWPRVAAERLFVGRTPAEVLAWVPMVFSLCRHAQTLAARLALDAAHNAPTATPYTATAAEQLALREEAARETVRRVLLDWWPHWAQRRATPEQLQAFRTAHDLAALKDFCETHILGMPCQTWLAISGGVDSGAAWLGAAGAADHIEEIIGGPFPVWDGQPRECSALAREANALAPLWQAGHWNAARWLARLRGLARSLSQADALHADAVATAEGVGVACVETARGVLTHVVKLADDGRIAHYHVIPPTLWHSHPQGILAAATRGQSTEAATAAMLLIDPCVDYVVEMDDA